MTYDEYVQNLANLLVVEPDNERFLALLPWIISYAELRILREPEFDFLATRSAAFVAGPTQTGQRNVDVPPEIVVVEHVNILMPANARGDDATRIPLLRVTKEFLDNIWPSDAQRRAPAPSETYFAIRNQWNENATILIGPTPDNAYYLAVNGTHRPTPLSEANQTTFMTIWLVDLFVAASMVVATGGILKNFGAQADDPQQAVSWEHIYQGLKGGVSVEALRQKSASSGWSDQAPNPIASVSRASPPQAQ